MECTGKRFRCGSGFEVGCGNCQACRYNLRRVMTARMLLEQSQHLSSCFLTLTYAQDPVSLSREHLRNFLKRLRYYSGRFRYVASGEYGDRSSRPHYHLAIFGLGDSDPGYSKAWTLGHILPLPLTADSCAYIAGYTLKKLGDTDRQRYIDAGLYPPFRRYSLHPGIGAVALPTLHKAALRTPDVVRQVRIGGRLFSIGPYLSRKVLALRSDSDSIRERRHRAVKTELLQREVIPELKALHLDKIENSKRKGAHLAEKEKQQAKRL